MTGDLVCQRCGGTYRYRVGETVRGKPIEDWFQQDRLSLCRRCFTSYRQDQTKAATDAAIQQVDGNADDVWKQVALDAVRLCATRHTEFTADEVWSVLENTSAQTHEPAALGPVFLRAARAGWIVNTGRRRKRSLYQQRHRELTIWGSTQFGQVSP